MGVGGSYLSSWCVFWRALGECIFLVLIFLDVWIWIVLVIFWLFSVSVCVRMGTVYSDVEFPASLRSLLTFFSGR